MSEAAINRKVDVLFVVILPWYLCRYEFSRVMRGSYSFCLSARARTEEIELVAERIFWYHFSGTSR